MEEICCGVEGEGFALSRGIEGDDDDDGDRSRSRNRNRNRNRSYRGRRNRLG